MAVEKITDNKEQNELKDLRQQIESLTTILTSATIGNVKSKVVEVILPQERRKCSKLLRKGFRGHLKRRNGWGHGWRECPTPENLNWRELVGGVVSWTPGSPNSIPTPIPNQNA